MQAPNRLSTWAGSARPVVSQRQTLYGDIDVKVRVQRQRSSGFVGRDDGYELIRGELAIGRAGHRATTLYSVGPQGPNHDAAMRISGEAPGRRVQSEQRLEGQPFVRRTATSDHPRQLTTRTPMSAEAFTSWTAGVSRSRCRAQDDALRRLAGGHEAPQGDQELPCEGHDHGLARATTGVRGARPIPLRQGTVLLEQQEAPGQLHHATPNAGVTHLSQAFLPPFGTALVWGAGEARIARHRPPVAQVAGQDLVHEHVGGLDPNPDH